MNKPIERASQLVGSQAALARLLGVTRGRVNQWKKGDDVPVLHCLAIERATEGQVSRSDLRPNDWRQIWPELAEVEQGA